MPINLQPGGSPDDVRAVLPLPDSGERVPTLSWPIVGIFVGAIATFAASTLAALTDRLPAPVTIGISGVAIFVLFTVLHDASHYSISKYRWVNVAFGRVAMFFVSPLISFKSFAFIHISHHRNTNDRDGSDPDHFISGASIWKAPARFGVMDFPYLSFVVRHAKSRPRAELIETAALLTMSVAVIIGCALTGHFWTLALVYLIPARVSMFVLAWWFDWLPHHDLEDTQRENRYRTTRNRVGAEWILTPLLLSQNYHLVHHLHPSIPFYRYVAAWRRNEAEYLERNAAIGTVFGQQLTPDEYREWKQLNAKMGRLLPLRRVSQREGRRADFHPIRVASVDKLTSDSVLIHFEIPDELQEAFAFEAGQHVTVRATINGTAVRRNYSICTSAVSGQLAIAIKRVPGGVFSTYSVEQLTPGDTLELLAPTGSFGTELDPLSNRRYVGIAVGSGITPVLSIVQTALAVETTSHFTLIYGNRDAASTMFRRDLDDLEARFGDRLRIIHVRSRDPQHPPLLSGRIDRDKLEHWLGSELEPASIDEWFLCGPVKLVAELREILIDHGAASEQVHVEVFQGYGKTVATDGFEPATVTIGLAARRHEVPLTAGETVLESALKAGLDAPYACLGGACGTCSAKVISGTVSMEQNFALSDTQVEAGYVLTCQSRPTTPSVTVEYEG